MINIHIVKFCRKVLKHICNNFERSVLSNSVLVKFYFDPRLLFFNVANAYNCQVSNMVLLFIWNSILIFSKTVWHLIKRVYVSN